MAGEVINAPRVVIIPTISTTPGTEGAPPTVKIVSRATTVVDAPAPDRHEADAAKIPREMGFVLQPHSIPAGEGERPQASVPPGPLMWFGPGAQLMSAEEPAGEQAKVRRNAVSPFPAIPRRHVFGDDGQFKPKGSYLDSAFREEARTAEVADNAQRVAWQADIHTAMANNEPALMEFISGLPQPQVPTFMPHSRALEELRKARNFVSDSVGPLHGSDGAIARAVACNKLADAGFPADMLYGFRIDSTPVTCDWRAAIATHAEQAEALQHLADGMTELSGHWAREMGPDQQGLAANLAAQRAVLTEMAAASQHGAEIDAVLDNMIPTRKSSGKG